MTLMSLKVCYELAYGNYTEHCDADLWQIKVLSPVDDVDVIEGLL